MKLHQFLFPPRCPFCDRITKDGRPCDSCVKNAEELTGTVCSVCGAYPKDCKCSFRSFAFVRNVSAFYYTGPVKRLVLRYKGGKRPQLASFMASRMLWQIEGRIPHSFAAVAFVPSSPVKGLKRGYIPARLLAEHLAAKLDLPLIDPLGRFLPRQQKNRSGAERWANARSLYFLRRGTTLSGNILLVDDLITSGASLSVCAELLMKAGAESVITTTFAMSVKKY